MSTDALPARLPRIRPELAFMALMVVLPVLPVPPFWITLTNYVGISAIVVLGLVLLTGVGGLTSFGQAAFVGVGAYATGFVSVRLGLSPWLGLLCGLLISFGVAWILGRASLRLSGHFLPLGTIAWALALYYLFGNLQVLGKYDGIVGIPAIGLGPWTLQSEAAMHVLIWVVLAVLMAGMNNMLASRIGRAMYCTKSHGVMAEAMGVDTAWARMAMFQCAALLATLGGWLYAHMQRTVNPAPFGLHSGIEYLFMAVLGGVSHLWGALIGAAVFTLLKDLLQQVFSRTFSASGNFEVIVFGLIMLVVLQRAPDGIWHLVRRLRPAPAPEPRHRHASTEVASSLPRRARSVPAGPVLEVSGLSKRFGGLVAVSNVSFSVHPGEIVALIGPNGAGKSSTFNLVTRLLPPTAGEVTFLGRPISKLCAREVTALGMARTFQHVKLVPGMSVLDNVAVGGHLRTGSSNWGSLGRSVLGFNAREEHSLAHEARRQIARVGLADVQHLEAGALSLGQQRIVEIARALCADPQLLLLDEPAAGLRHGEKVALAQLLARLRGEGMAILIVEHDMDFLMNLADRVVVMNFGAKIAEGTPAEVQAHPEVISAYLGDDEQ